MSVAYSRRGLRFRRMASFGLVLGVMWSLVPQVTVSAATGTLFLMGDGVPLASLAPAAPTGTTLPNYDPGRDDLPGLVLQPTQLDDLAETDPAKYQVWTTAKGRTTVNGPVSMTLWSASDGFASEARGAIQAGLYDCQQPESNCKLLAHQTHTANPWSPNGDWTEHTITWPHLTYSVPNGHHLVVRLVVGSTSETPLLFAYGTADYPARIELLSQPSGGPPVASDDTAATDEDTPIVVDVLSNDTDPDGDSISVTSVTQGAHGSVTDSGDGTITYAPDPDWNGEDSFSYTISDGTAAASATVTVTVGAVNDAPVTQNLQVATEEDTPVVVDPIGATSDVDGDALSIETVGSPSEGTVTDNGDGTLTFRPPPDWNGSATFSFSVTDGNASDAGNVIVDVGAVNDPPVARIDTVSTPEGVGLLIDVLANDVDVDGDQLGLTGTITGSAGTVGIEGDAVRYEPPADWHGLDTFTYSVTDGAFVSSGTVEVEVIPAQDHPTGGTDPEPTGDDPDPTFGAEGDGDGDGLTPLNTQPDSTGTEPPLYVMPSRAGTQQPQVPLAP